MPIRIELHSRAVQAALAKLQRRLANLTQPMGDIGEALSETTKRRFRTSTGPRGQAWAPNAESTLLNYLRKRGGLSKRKTASEASSGSLS